MARPTGDGAHAEYVDWFNARRLHGAIGHISPAEHEANYNAQNQAEELAPANI
jgi:putative transposase